MINRASVFLMTICLMVFCAGCERKWEGPVRTVLYYAVESNLGEDISRNISNMEEAYRKGEIYGGELFIFRSDSYGDASLYKVVKKGKEIKHETVAIYPGHSGVESEVMRNVMMTVRSVSPADSYGLVMSSHGTAWMPADVRNMKRAFGECNGRWMELPTLAEAIPDGMFEFIMFDACSMGAVECAYELKNDCDVFIASSSEVLVAGFPYSVMTPMFFVPNPDYDAIVRSFYDYYENSNTPYADIAAVKTSGLDALAASFAAMVGDKGESALYDIETFNAQMLTYLPQAPVELHDMSDIVRLTNASEELKNSVLREIERTVIASYHTDYHYCARLSEIVPIESYCGMSIYAMREDEDALNEWYRGNMKWYSAVFGAL